MCQSIGYNATPAPIPIPNVSTSAMIALLFLQKLHLPVAWSTHSKLSPASSSSPTTSSPTSSPTEHALRSTKPGRRQSDKVLFGNEPDISSYTTATMISEVPLLSASLSRPCPPKKSPRYHSTQTLDEFVGQEQIKQNLTVAIQAAQKRSEPLEHLLFTATPVSAKLLSPPSSPAPWEPP